MSLSLKLTNLKANQVDWQKLKVLYALAQAGNFEKTHELTGMAISSISKHISHLEKEVGVVLVNRKKGSRGNILTEAGETLLKITTEIYKNIEEGIAEIENRENLFGTISLATAKGFGISWLLPRLIEFNKKYPELIFDLSFVDNFANVVNRTADLYISTKFGEASYLLHDHLGKFEHRAYASKEYLLQHGTPQTIDDLASHKIITYKFRSVLTEANWLLKTGLQSGTEREPSLIVDDVNAAISAVEYGLGICPFVEYIELYKPNFVRILNNYDMGALDLYIIRAPENKNSRKINMLISFLINT